MSSALSTLLDHTRARRDEAQAAVAATQQRHRRLHDQGSQLVDYRQQCNRNGPAQPGRVVSIEALRAQQQLIERIEQALQQHARQCTEIENELCRRQQALLDLELRAASIEQLLARRASMQNQAAARREQRQADDATQARAHAARADHPMPAD